MDLSYTGHVFLSRAKNSLAAERQKQRREQEVEQRKEGGLERATGRTKQAAGPILLSKASAHSKSNPGQSLPRALPPCPLLPTLSSLSSKLLPTVVLILVSHSKASGKGSLRCCHVPLVLSPGLPSPSLGLHFSFAQ